MNELRPVADLSREELYDEIEAVLRAGVIITRDRLRLFLARVDWSSREQADPWVLDALGALEGWTTLFDEGDMEATEHAVRLLSLLPSERDITFRVGERLITATAAGDSQSA